MADRKKAAVVEGAAASVATFKRSLKLFVNNQKLTMKHARAASEQAIVHFEKYGDLTPCQQFHDAIDANFGRPVAFLKWLDKHAPVTMEKKKLKKDKSADAKPFDIKGALSKPYWEALKNTEQIAFSGDDVVSFLKGIKKFRTSKYEPADEAATKQLERAEVAVNQLVNNPHFAVGG
jgi:hypothetical protein